MLETPPPNPPPPPPRTDPFSNLLPTVGGLAGAVKPEEIAESFARAGAAVAGVELMRDADGGFWD